MILGSHITNNLSGNMIAELIFKTDLTQFSGLGPLGTRQYLECCDLTHIF